MIVDADAACLHRWWHLHCWHTATAAAIVAVESAMIHIWADVQVIRHLMLYKLN